MGILAYLIRDATGADRTPMRTSSGGLMLLSVGWKGALAGLVVIGITLSTALAGQVATRHVSAPADLAIGKPTAAGGLISAPPPPGFSLSIAASPLSICTLFDPACVAGTTVSRITLGAVPLGGAQYWPDVQVVFAIDGTFMNGVYTQTDDPGYNLCDRSGYQIPCEESNGLPVFVADAGLIAESIQSENPHTQLSFGLVDFESTLCDYGDCDGSVFHVDVGQFVTAASFQMAVQSTFQATYLGGGYSCADCDFWDNFLHAPSITALFGVLSGAGIDWSPKAHHVIIWLGDTAPRDGRYPENYCTSGWDGGLVGGSCYSKTCEPAYAFGIVTMPNCEGWTTTQDGNPQDSIAGLAHTAPACVASLGSSCTIDAIDLWSSNTDPYSLDWPGLGANPQNDAWIRENVDSVLLAGCDIAQATGGSWEGPAWFSCPSGAQGSLQYVSHGPRVSPNLVNPTLLAAFRSASLGAVPILPVAASAGESMFKFVPFGAIAPSASLNAMTSCWRQAAALSTCQTQPTKVLRNGLSTLEWNWSTDPRSNVMYPGDTWVAQFDIVATGPPYTKVPVDACTLAICTRVGSHAVMGLLTSVSYSVPNDTIALTQSFPLAEVNVFPPPVAPIAPYAPPPPGLGFPLPVGIGPPIPVAQPLGVPNVSLLSGLSVSATAAGVIAAAFTRVMLKNKSIAMQIAVKSGVLRNKSGGTFASDAQTVGRWE